MGPLFRLRRAWGEGNAVAEPAHGMNDIGRDFAAKPPNEDFDGVRIAVEILLIEMIDKLRARHDAGLVVHEIGKEPEFKAGYFDGRPVKGHPRRARIELQGAAFELGLCKARAAAKQCPHARDDLLHLKGLGDIIVGAGVDAGNLFAPAVARRQDEHGRFDVVPAPAFEYAKAVDLAGGPGRE